MTSVVQSDPIFHAYGEPLAVGDPLPDTPLFLRPGRHVPLPLQESYLTTWQHFPPTLERRARVG